ncbi:GNAT family N-acetyltransferase [Chloroflexota bacterium]
MEVWWRVFGSGAELYLGVVRQGEEIIGIAPLLVRDKTASILGSADVCDYLDFIVIPGRERDFFAVLLDDLVQKGINHLDLRSLRPDSTVPTELVPLARDREYDVCCNPEDVSLELDLPSTWEEYLATLVPKQRHEVKRKLRRLGEEGDLGYRSVEDKASIRDILVTFLKLFTESREEKATFMTASMESFFSLMADTMSEARLLRIGILELDARPTAMVMSFDYHDCVYLYNSGYDPQYRSLSVGLLSKVLCIKESIQRGRKRFDFMKGGESYKYHLGGREIPLYSCQITLR